MSKHIQLQQFSHETQSWYWAGEMQILPDGRLAWTDTALVEMLIKQELFDPENDRRVDITDGLEVFFDSLIRLGGNYKLYAVAMDSPGSSDEVLPTPEGVETHVQFPKDIDRRLVPDDGTIWQASPETLALLEKWKSEG